MSTVPAGPGFSAAPGKNPAPDGNVGHESAGSSGRKPGSAAPPRPVTRAPRRRFGQKRPQPRPTRLRGRSDPRPLARINQKSAGKRRLSKNSKISKNFHFSWTKRLTPLGGAGIPARVVRAKGLNGVCHWMSEIPEGTPGGGQGHRACNTIYEGTWHASAAKYRRPDTGGRFTPWQQVCSIRRGNRIKIPKRGHRRLDRQKDHVDRRQAPLPSQRRRADLQRRRRRGGAPPDGQGEDRRGLPHRAHLPRGGDRPHQGQPPRLPRIARLR